MADDNQPKKIDGDLLLVQVAGLLLQGAKQTNDPRITQLAEQVVAELKKGDILETLLLAYAQHQSATAATPAVPPAPQAIGINALQAQIAERLKQMGSLK